MVACLNRREDFFFSLFFFLGVSCEIFKALGVP
jgi:hypothetical protein